MVHVSVQSFYNKKGKLSMKNFLKLIGFGIMFFVLGITFSRWEVFSHIRHFLRSSFVKSKMVNESVSENYYDSVMRIALQQFPTDEGMKDALDKISALCTSSDSVFKALIEYCENSDAVLQQEFIEQLQKFGFVDAMGKINYECEAVKVLKEFALHVKAETLSVKSQQILDAGVLCDFFKVLTKSFVTKERGSYQESLLNFKFSFSNYRDLLQLFTESFLEKDYYFVTANKNPFIIDCGSNLGMSILFFKNVYPKAEILAFEPSHISLSFLNKNINDNNLNGITVIDKAVSNKKQKCFFHEVPGNTLGGALGGRTDDACTINVDSVILSEYIERPVDFVKVDVEGAEVLIFEDLDQSGKIKFIKEMGIECHGSCALNSVLKVLNKNNFVYQVKREDLWGDAYLVHAFNKLNNVC